MHNMENVLPQTATTTDSSYSTSRNEDDDYVPYSVDVDVDIYLVGISIDVPNTVVYQRFLTSDDDTVYPRDRDVDDRTYLCRKNVMYDPDMDVLLAPFVPPFPQQRLPLLFLIIIMTRLYRGSSSELPVPVLGQTLLLTHRYDSQKAPWTIERGSNRLWSSDQYSYYRIGFQNYSRSGVDSSSFSYFITVDSNDVRSLIVFPCNGSSVRLRLRLRPSLGCELSIVR
jgi:hypothetical protein